MTVADLTKIPEEMVPDLDPEWVELWNNHGRFNKRADQVDIATYRKDPGAYSFTYANDVGKFSCLLPFELSSSAHCESANGTC